MTGFSQRRFSGDANRSEDRRLGFSDCLHLAATPTFTLMALLTALYGGGTSSMMCMGMAGSSLPDSMGFMYLLMGVFQAAPWVRLASRP